MHRRWIQVAAVLTLALLAGAEAGEARRPRHRPRAGEPPSNGHASQRLVRAHRQHVAEVVNRYLDSGRLTPEQQFWAQIGLDRFLADNREVLQPVNVVEWTGDPASLAPNQDLESLVPLPASDLSPMYRPVLPLGGIVCLPGDELLLGGRFLVTATYEDFSHVVRRGFTCRMTATGGYFFFSPNPLAFGNVEVPMKILNACSGGNPPGHWVFISGLTNYGVAVTVFDLFTGLSKPYVNTLGQTFVPRIDQQTPFPCP